MAAATVFGKSQAQLARYGYERLVYTVGSTALATGRTALITTRAWNPMPDGALWRAEIEALAATQNDQVTLTYMTDPANSLDLANQGPTTALRNGVQFTPLSARAVSQLGLFLNNTSGAAIADWQTNYVVGMRRLSIAEKLLAQRAGLAGYALSAPEWQSLINLGAATAPGHLTTGGLAGLIAKGTQPVPLARQLPGLWDNRLLSREYVAYNLDATTADNPFAHFVTGADPTDLSRGRFGVIEGIALEGAPAVTVTIDRDGQNGYWSGNGSAFVATDDAAWPLWVPFLDYATIHCTVTSGTAAVTAPIRITVGWYELSEALAIQFGRITHPSQCRVPETFDKVRAGLVLI